MGISRDGWHKRRKTGGRRNPIRKKRKFELGRPPSMTKIGPKRVHEVRVRGGSLKLRAMRLDQGNYSWGSQGVSRKTRIIDTVYNASNNELVRTKTLVKSAIVQIDSMPFRHWFEAHYLLPLGRKKTSAKAAIAAAQEAAGAEGVPEDVLAVKRGKKTMRKFETRQKDVKAKIDPALAEQFAAGRLLAKISSRPGQVGRCDGVILEGKELEFYSKKIKAKKTK